LLTLGNINEQCHTSSRNAPIWRKKNSAAETQSFIKFISNFTSWTEAANHSLAYLFGGVLSLTNIPFIKTDFVLTLLCLLLANGSVAANGFNVGRKDMGLMPKDIHDLLNEKIIYYINQVATMDGNEITVHVNQIKGALTTEEKKEPGTPYQPVAEEPNFSTSV